MKTMTVSELPRVQTLYGDRKLSATKTKKVLLRNKLLSSPSTETKPHLPKPNFSNTGGAFHWIIASLGSIVGLGLLVGLFNTVRGNPSSWPGNRELIKNPYGLI